VNAMRCCVNGCLNEKGTGDIYFCIFCRSDWRMKCHEIFGIDRQAGLRDIMVVLDEFKRE